jgi:hypothetical protein
MRVQATRPASTRDLSLSERDLVVLLDHLEFGHMESIQIRRGAVVLQPWPTVVKVLKFGGCKPSDKSVRRVRVEEVARGSV